MSRTKRDHSYLDKGHQQIPYENKLKGKPARMMKTKSVKVLELTAAELLDEAGYNIPNRLGARANVKGPTIPDAWDELPVAARTELVVR